MQAGWQRHQDRRGSPGAGLWHGLSSPHASVNAILGPLPAGSGGPGPPAVNTAEEFPGENPLLCAAQRWPCPHGTGEGAPVPPQPRHPCRGTRASQEEGNTQLVKPQVLKSRDASSASSSTSHFFFCFFFFFFSNLPAPSALLHPKSREGRALPSWQRHPRAVAGCTTHPGALVLCWAQTRLQRSPPRRRHLTGASSTLLQIPSRGQASQPHHRGRHTRQTSDTNTRLHAVNKAATPQAITPAFDPGLSYP